MKIPDTNLLIYAHDETSPFHGKARIWLSEALADASEPVGIAPTAALGFIRLMINPRVFADPLKAGDAIQLVDSWFSAGAVLIEAGRGHFALVGQLMDEAHGGPDLLADAHLAALAIERRSTLYTHDRDFLRFRGLRAKYPLD